MTFVTDFLYSYLELKDGTDIKLERAHRAPGPKSSDPMKAAQSIIAQGTSSRWTTQSGRRNKQQLTTAEIRRVSKETVHWGTFAKTDQEQI